MFRRRIPLFLCGLALIAGCSSGRAGSPAVVAITADQVRSLAARPGAKATLVNVWATWCAPCREEFPGLLEVGKKRRADGLRLVLVSADFEDQTAAVRKFLRARGVADTAYIISGDPMAFINRLNPKWTGALPATFVYNSRGELDQFWEGAAGESRFNESVDRAMAQ